MNFSVCHKVSICFPSFFFRKKGSLFIKKIMTKHRKNLLYIKTFLPYTYHIDLEVPWARFLIYFEQNDFFFLKNNIKEQKPPNFFSSFSFTYLKYFLSKKIPSTLLPNIKRLFFTLLSIFYNENYHLKNSIGLFFVSSPSHTTYQNDFIFIPPHHLSSQFRKDLERGTVTHIHT